MDPLQPVPMPTHAVLVGLTAQNSWQTGTDAAPVYLAYVATNSTQSASFVSLQSATPPVSVLRVSSRRSFSQDYQYGVVVELSLGAPLEGGQAVYVMLAQSGATTYYPPQPIQD